MNSNKLKKQKKQPNIYCRLLCILISLLLCFQNILNVKAEDTKTTEEYLEEAEERKNDPVATNDIDEWPDGPIIGADSAILMDADTKQILYYKNADAKQYPASTTKIMACLVAMESGISLDDKVTISKEAIDANDWDGSNMALTAGEILSVEELLKGILICSANEACNALAEYSAGSMNAFVEKMNQRARELGCLNTHFVTTNGLHNEDHYTTAYDLALIGCEFFKYDVLCDITRTTGVELEETDEHASHSIYSKNKLLKGRDYAYEYLRGTKTGYTGSARQTLVSCAEKNGMRLVCVIMKEESPYQFSDTVALFEYGFNNFSSYNMSDYQSPYNINQADFFESGKDILGSSSPLITMDSNFSVWLPSSFDSANIETRISYSNPEPGDFGTVNYYYNGWLIGSSGIKFSGIATLNDSSDISQITDSEEPVSKPVMINIGKVIGNIAIIIITIFILIVGYVFLRKYLTKQRVKNIKRFFNNLKKKHSEDERRKRSRKRDENYEKRNAKKTGQEYIPIKGKKYQKRKPPSRRRDFDDYY